MMKMILGALTAVMLIGAVAVQPAEAACWWNGWGWACSHPHPYWWWHHHHHHDWDHDRW
jgi:hypothetical protein